MDRSRWLILVADLAIVGGTVAVALAGAEDSQSRVVDTPFGAPSEPLTRALWRGQHVWRMSRHGSGIAPHAINYRANLWALHSLGVRRVIAVHAVGGIAEDMAPGRWVAPDQLIDYAWGRAHSFVGSPAGAALNVSAHCDFSQPYSADLRRDLQAALRAAGEPAAESCVYGCTQGPRLETIAEVARLRQDGCDVVGMTGMPEAALARELGMRYAALCLVVNCAGADALSMPDIESTMHAAMPALELMLARVVAPPDGGERT